MEGIEKSIEDLLGLAQSQVSITTFIVQFVLTTLLSLFLGFIYTHYGSSLTRRKTLSRTLMLVSITTMIIITIVKSSLALSLGLVGALSIVRFRTAIKDPEELAYFFIAIAIGLGMGASQILITLTGALLTSLVIFLRARLTVKEDVIQNLSISILKPDKDFNYEQLVSTFASCCDQLELRRLDENEESIEMSFFIRFKSFEMLLESKRIIQQIDSKIQFSYMEIV